MREAREGIQSAGFPLVLEKENIDWGRVGCVEEGAFSYGQPAQGKNTERKKESSEATEPWEWETGEGCFVGRVGREWLGNEWR